MDRVARTGAVALAALATLGAASPGSADSAGGGADPEVVAARQAAYEAQAPGGETTEDVQPVGPGDPASFGDLYYLSAVSTSGGYIEVAARDNPKQDAPGIATTTLRVYGNSAAFREGLGNLGLRDQFTCTGAGIGGLSIGGSGWSVSGGPTSSTLTLTALRESASVLRSYYTEGGHFRCRASNLTLAHFTRRGTATTSYKNTETRAEDSYSFTW